MKRKPIPPPAPRKLPPADAADRIRALAADGWSVRGIAAQLGIGQDLLRRWFDEDPALDEAMQRGREDERHTLHNVLYRAATEGSGKDSLIAAMFLLKARHGYREGEQQEQGNRVAITFNLPGPLPLESFTVDHEHNTNDRAERVPAKITRGS